MNTEQMRAARARGESRSDWERVRREQAQGQEPEPDRDAPDAAPAMRKALKQRGRPIAGQPKTAISLRVPNDTLARWKATGPGWQTRMVKALDKAIPSN